MIIRILLICMLIGTYGCSVKLIPHAQPIDQSLVSSFHSNQNISLINKNQTSELSAWTEEVIRALSSELRTRGMNITDDSSKNLHLNILDNYQNLLYMYWFMKCGVTLQVEADNGYSRNIYAEDVSLVIQGACDQAVTKVVVEVLNDPIIISYLTKNESNNKNGSSGDNKDEINLKMQKLKELYTNGLISDEEYRRKKAELLEKL